MFDYHLQLQIMIRNEIEEYTYLEYIVNANPAHENEIRKRIGMECSDSDIMDNTLPLTLSWKVHSASYVVLAYSSENRRLTIKKAKFTKKN